MPSPPHPRRPKAGTVITRLQPALLAEGAVAAAAAPPPPLATAPPATSLPPPLTPRRRSGGSAGALPLPSDLVVGW
jgi:hypothetical protein